MKNFALSGIGILAGTTVGGDFSTGHGWRSFRNRSKYCYLVRECPAPAKTTQSCTRRHLQIFRLAVKVPTC